MPGNAPKIIVALMLPLFLLLMWQTAAPAADKSPTILGEGKDSLKEQKRPEQALPEIPQAFDSTRIRQIVDGLSDDQVRRLLIQELEKSVSGRAKKDDADKLSGFAKIIQSTEENISVFHTRFSEIQYDVMAIPKFFSQAYSDVRRKDGGAGILLTLGAIAILLAAGMGSERVFEHTTASMRERFMNPQLAHWTDKLKRHLLFAAIDFISMCVFCAVPLALFFLFFNSGPLARLALMTSLVVILSVRMIRLVSRFLLSPEAPVLRVLSLEDKTALDLYRWITRIALVFGGGFLASGLLELHGISLEVDLAVHALTSAVALSIILYLAFKHRASVALFLCHGDGDRSALMDQFRAELAPYWHLFALPCLLLTWALWVFYLLVGRSDLVSPLLATLYSVPIFLVVEGMGQRLLSAMFRFIDMPDGPESGCEGEQRTDGDRGEGEEASPTREGGSTVPLVSRLVSILRRCLSVSIAGLILFGLLRLWRFEIVLGEEITEAAFEILLVVTLAFLAWSVISEALNRKIQEVQSSIKVDEDADEGGTGGSRLGTLLQIVRKFLLVVLLVAVGLIILSTVGIDIHPLLAGAGILGLAIGLGTQNLIKDIVSGLFFLIDDAFRIGDYVESGKARGTVEAISIRSLKLRHSRGMVHNVPFSQLGMVTNFSRDYIVVKLDFRVPFGTDFDRVRKVVKQINKEIHEDEEFKTYLLGPIKFAGVLAFDDSALIMRVKFKSKPGLQTLVQRQVLRRLQELFRERGLEFATRHVMVHMPDGSTSESPEEAGQMASVAQAPPKRPGLSAAAGAALAIAMVDEEAIKKQTEESNESE